MAAKKTYIVITPFFPTPDSYRGCYVYDAVRAIQRDGRYHVEVFVPKRRGDKREGYDIDGLRVHLFPMTALPSYLFNGLTFGINARSLAKAVVKAGIDPADVAVAHGHTSGFGAAALGLKRLNPEIKVLCQHHDLDPYTIRNGRLAGWLPNLSFRAHAARRAYEQIDLHVCISRAVEWNLSHFPQVNPDIDFENYNYKLRKLRGMRKTRLKATTVLYNGVDTRIFNTEGRKTEGTFRIGCIANFQDLKEHRTLLRALGKLQDRGLDFEAELIGTGPELEGCKQLSHELKLDSRVMFLAELPHERLADFYRRLDLFVLPSVFEGFGCVYTEAWSCGTPFIACQGQGIADYIFPEDANLWLVSQHDADDLSDKIENYIKKRPEQRLRYLVDIDTLMRDFLDKLQ